MNPRIPNISTTSLAAGFVDVMAISIRVRAESGVGKFWNYLTFAAPEIVHFLDRTCCARHADSRKKAFLRYFAFPITPPSIRIPLRPLTHRSYVANMEARAIAWVNRRKSMSAGVVVPDTSSSSTSTACTTRK